MKSISIAIGIILLVIVVPTLGCTWVDVTTEGQDVRILRSIDVGDCEQVGKANAKTADRVGIFARTDRKIREELDALARNQAVDMGGNAIVPIGSPADGRQAFDVYRCTSR